MGAVASVSFWAPQVSFLWHNVIGAGAVVVVGVLLSVVGPTGCSCADMPRRHSGCILCMPMRSPSAPPPAG
jgi:hypothetical protein